MSMRNRTRVVTPRRKRFWTTSRVALTISSTTQVAVSVGADYRTETGKDYMDGATVARSYVHGGFTVQAAVTTALLTQIGFGLTWGAFAIAGSAIPDVNQHDGDYFLHDASAVLQPADAGTVVRAMQTHLQNGMVRIDSKAQRTGLRGQDLFLVAAADSSFEETVTMRASVTLLWLLS